MHLQDKRLFHFGDSLYHSLEQVEGFALEVNFKDFMDSIFQRKIEDEEKKRMEEEQVKIERKKLDHSADSLLKKMGIVDDRISRGDLKKIREYRMKQVMHNEMPTIVDGYLYGLALRQGKWTGGIEDVSDQIGLLDETGAELTPEEVFQPEAGMRNMLEEMIHIYEAQDLQKMSGFLLSGSLGQKDEVLIRRNIKMARRMDSLSALRTMFFAVGAAHLPGDSGVISLLRARGFHVDPVFSTQKIDADVYARQLEKAPWTKVEDEEKLYSIEMPGAPSDYDLFGSAVKMKMFFDLTTMTFYMTGQSIGRINSPGDGEKLFRRLADNMGSKGVPLKTKPISQGNAKGIEGSFVNSDGSYRMQLLQKDNAFFMLIAGSEKKANLSTPDINRFFSSFVANTITTHRDWVSFGLPDKAFHLRMPAEPKANKTIDRYAEGTGWNFKTYDYADNVKGLYYLVQVRDIGEGYFLDGDSNFFQLFIQDFSKRVDKVTRTEIGTYQGLPSLHFDGISEKEGALYRTFLVVRGNRVYSLVVGGSKNADFSDVDSFFHSFTVDDYQPVEWKTYGGEGFTTTAPAAFKKRPTPNGDSTRQEDYFLSYNPNEAVSYHVFKQPFDSLYWYHDDSAYFQAKVKSYVTGTDTLVKQEWTHNGSLLGIELTLGASGHSNVKKVRMFTSGDSLYILMSYIENRYVDRPENVRFFNDFRVLNEREPTLYTSKADKLFEEMKSSDSARFERATVAFNSLAFTSKDLPFLRKALLISYRDSSDGYYGMSDHVVSALRTLNDTGAIEVIADHYRLPGGRYKTVTPAILKTLSSLHTQRSYDLLKQLLPYRPPTLKGSNMMAGLFDSMQLTRSLYPDMMELFSDSNYASGVTMVTERLVDSNVLSANDLVPYRQVMLDRARLGVPHAGNDYGDEYSKGMLISIIRIFPGDETNKILLEYLHSSSILLKKAAALSLLKMGKTVDSKELEKIAADKELRGALYEALDDMGRLSVFPAAYASQKALAESEIYSYAGEDYEVTSMAFLGERIALFNGKKQKFYLFKVAINTGDSIETHLGIAGPYEVNARPVVISQSSGLYWDEGFSATQVDAQLKKYLKQAEDN
jgi:uncharacterized protein YbaP (TraB family)